MKIQDNKLSSVSGYFHRQLDELYHRKEVDQFFTLAAAQLLSLSNLQILMDKNRLLSESDLLGFIRVVKGLKNYEPIQYLLGTTQFMELDIKTTPAALIPRPETEELIDWMVKTFISESRTPAKAIDIGTGTGCIALSIKHFFPKAHVEGIDISKEAVLLAGENAKMNLLEVDFREEDALSLKPARPTYDLIMSNPPYVRKSESSRMQPNVLAYEPHLALFVEDNDPLIFYQAISKWAHDVLNYGGWLYFEINENLAEETSLILINLGFGHVEIRHDIRNKPRMIRAKRTH